ncbi:MAG: thermonuclease family protein [Sandaracinaceae bacterium]
MTRSAVVLSCALLILGLSGCPRPVPHADAGASDGGGVDAGARDAGDLPVNGFTDPLVLNDDALAALDPTVLPASSTPCRAPVLVRVTYVIDGDTFEASGLSGAFSGHVRLIGVNAPEIAHPGQAMECYGNEATTFTSALEGHAVWLTFDDGCFDNFDRVLAYVHVGVGDGGFFQRQLLRRGFARELHVAPNTTYRTMFEGDETMAINDRTGLWGACP